MVQVLQSTPATITFRVYVNGDLTNADSTPTVTAADASGTAVSVGSVSSPSTGVYQVVVSGQSTVKTITVTLSGDLTGEAFSLSQQVEVVGSLLFTEADARGFDDGRLDETAADDDAIAAARTRACDVFEDYCGVSFIRRFGRVKWSGPAKRDPFGLFPAFGVRLNGGEGYHRYLRSVVSFTENGSARSTSDLVVDPVGKFHLVSGSFKYPTRTQPFPQVIGYEYGFYRVPEDIRRAALVLARYELLVHDVTDRMVSYNDALGSVRLSTPGPNRPTGLPLVDETLNRYREKQVVG